MTTLTQTLQGKGSTYYENSDSIDTGLSPALVWKFLCILTVH